MAKPKRTNLKPATPEQVAKFGHFAATLRKWMKDHDVSIRELNEKLGRAETNTAPYMWINAKMAPGPTLRPLLAKVTGIPGSELMPRSMAPGPGKAVMILPRQEPTPLVPVARNVLSFIVTNDNMATIKVDATLPLETATPLLRMLLDAGVIFNKVE